MIDLFDAARSRAATATAALPAAEMIAASALTGADLGSAVIVGATPGQRAEFVSNRGSVTVRAWFAGIPWDLAPDRVIIVDGSRAVEVDVSAASIVVSPTSGLDDTATASGEIEVTVSDADLFRPSSDPAALVAVSAAATLAGALAEAVRLMTEHAGTRIQFGRPLVAFQAVQGLIAESVEELWVCEHALEHAVASLGTPSALALAAVAQAQATDAASLVARHAHQVHGAIGFTREHPLQLVTRRLWFWRDQCGSARYWHERVGASLTSPSAAFWGSLTELFDASDAGGQPRDGR